MTISLQAYHVHQITRVEESVAGAVVRLSEGEDTLLPRSHPAFDANLRSLLRFQQDGYPVGVELDSAGRLLNVGSLDREMVWEIKDAPTAQAVNLWLVRQASLVLLLKDQPHFREILTNLQEAHANQRPIWCVVVGAFLVAAGALPADVDAELCRLYPDL